MSALPTDALGGGALLGGLWASPQARDYRSPDAGRLERDNGGGNANLNDQVDKWPTPSADNFRTRGGDRADEKGLDQLVKQWPSPRAEDSESCGAHPNRSQPDSTGSAVSLWTTPTSRKGGPDDPADRQERGAGGSDLRQQIENWSTPRVQRGATQNDKGDPEKPRLTLEGEVKQFPTPSARDVKGANAKSYEERGGGKQGEQLPNALAHQNGEKGQLNPQWEAPLMGWPCFRFTDDQGTHWWDWTSPDPLPQGLAGEGEWFDFFPGYPAGQGPYQKPWEPPRTVPKGTIPFRRQRVEMVGNGVVPWCAAAAFMLLFEGL